ncbi:MAG: PAS domain-containing protein [Candidatus Xenobiia bacterium LiM19]
MWRRCFANAIARKRSDELLRESRERLSLATESAGMGLWIIDIPTDQVWVTDGARELLSFPADEAPTMESFIRTAHDNDRALVRQAMKQAIEMERKIFLEYRVEHPDGRISWISTRGNSRAQCGRGRIDKIMGATIDVSDRKQAEAEAQVLREELFHVTRGADPGAAHRSHHTRGQPAPGRNQEQRPGGAAASLKRDTGSAGDSQRP